MCSLVMCLVFCFKQKTAYEMRISDWSSDVCSSDLRSGKCPDDEAQHTMPAREVQEHFAKRDARQGCKLGLIERVRRVPAAEPNQQATRPGFQRDRKRVVE